MTVLILGATGATGRLLVQQLLERGVEVRVVVRSRAGLPESVRDHENLTVIEAAVLDLSDAEMAEAVKGCSAVASCLGHNLSFRGIFGPPHRLVTDAVRRLCETIRANGGEGVTRFVLMNTTAIRNGDLGERVSVAQKVVLGLLRVLLPPHADNEQAADYLRTVIGQGDDAIEWVSVRPDNLIDENAVTKYELHASPIRDAIFNAGKTSRINVAHFMAELITSDDAWNRWKGQMPVIYQS